MTPPITPERHTEAAFEAVIEAHWLAHGYTSISSGYDRERALFPDVAINFIKTTQPKEWAKLEKLHAAKTTALVLADLTKWLDNYGALHTLRHGFKCYGRSLRVAFFKAAHTLNPDLEARYAANVLGVTRQLAYSARTDERGRRGVLDLTLSLNGIPVVTVELKNPFTGQNAEDAKRQYCNDRDQHEPLFAFKRRTLVHFAADTQQVWMTTRLAGVATHFLPFNRGDKHGAGNPPDPTGRSYQRPICGKKCWNAKACLMCWLVFCTCRLKQSTMMMGDRSKKKRWYFHATTN